jgi:hypothetical protein
MTEKDKLIEYFKLYFDIEANDADISEEITKEQKDLWISKQQARLDKVEQVTFALSTFLNEGCPSEVEALLDSALEHERKFWEKRIELIKALPVKDNSIETINTYRKEIESISTDVKFINKQSVIAFLTENPSLISLIQDLIAVKRILFFSEKMTLEHVDRTPTHNGSIKNQLTEDQLRGTLVFSILCNKTHKAGDSPEEIERKASTIEEAARKRFTQLSLRWWLYQAPRSEGKLQIELNYSQD